MRVLRVSSFILSLVMGLNVITIFPITSGAEFEQESAASDDDWMLEAEHRKDWRAGLPDPPAQSLPPLQAGPGVTALSGEVLSIKGKALKGVTLEIDDQKTKTNPEGQFLLVLSEEPELESGVEELLIDGRAVGEKSENYGLFEARVEIERGKTTVLPFTIYLPKIDTAHAVTIPSPTTSEVVVTTPHIPGLELHIPRGTVITDEEGEVVTSVSITPIPVDRPPFPLPTHVQVPIYFTIQPGGAYLANSHGYGARLFYPNYTNSLPGARANFWHYDPEERGWYIYGLGTVSEDGEQVIPDRGVTLYEFTGAMINTGDTPPSNGPAPGNISSADGDPVDLSTGLFVLNKTDLFLPDILPLALTRTYRQGDNNTRAFGIGMTHPYAMFLWSANSYQELDLILPDGGRIHYVRISPGTGFTDAVFEHTATPTAFYKSCVVWNGDGWDLMLNDGTVYVFGENAPLQAIRDRYGNQITVRHANGQSGNITSVTSPNGRWIEFSYDASGRITQVKDSIGRVVIYTYDATGRLQQVKDPKGGLTQYTYDTSHRMLTLKDARSIVFLTNTYDATTGRVTKQTQADSKSYQFSYVTDASGKITQTTVTDPRLNQRRVTFSASGYTLTDTSALGKTEQQTTTYEREAGSQFLLSLTDPLARKTTYTYDPLGNVTSITRLADTPDAVELSLEYEPTFNQVSKITDPLQHSTTFAYDAQGSVISVTDPLLHTTTLTHNPAGQPLSIADPLGNATQFTYDFGDLAALTDPLGNSVTRFTDSAGRLISETSPLGSRIRYAYDALNQLQQLTDPLNGLTTFSYDSSGNLLSVKDARNNTTTYTYNNMDYLVTRKDPLLRVESYLYDGVGNLTKVTDRKGQATTFTYDALNRHTKTTYADSSTITFTYDKGDRLTKVVDSLMGTLTYTYDSLDRLLSETTPQGTVTYTYDLAGRRTSMSVPGEPTITYTYDDADRLTKITKGTSIVTLSYDNADRRTSLTLPGGIVTTYSYDQASQLTGITYRKGSSVRNLAYTYDRAGNRIKTTGSWSRTGLPQAIASATYNAANHQLTLGNKTMTYDLNGNLLTLADPSGTTTFSWNARNQLVGMSGPSVIASFQYDGLSRREVKTINGTTTEFLFDGVNPVQETSGATVLANTLSGLGVDEYFMRTDSAGTRSLLTDGLGSTVALMNSGGVQAQYTYEPFGKSTAAAGSNPFQYTGRENDGTGLYYYRARYYHPTLQRFISEDPIEFAGGDLNLYAYAFNSPVNYTDPDGENPLVAAIGAACAGGAVLGVGIDFGFAVLSGRKFTWGDAGRSALGGCAGGLIGLGLGKALTVAGKGLRALGEAGFVRVGREGTSAFGRQLERQLAKNGPKSIQKTLRSLQKVLAEHEAKLPTLQPNRVSSVLREIRTFTQQIREAEEFIRRQGL